MARSHQADVDIQMEMALFSADTSRISFCSNLSYFYITVTIFASVAALDEAVLCL